ncbi:D-alanine--D-alanine ligase [Gangjinia marincola]|uniref:D-alanine--D-alanine ligase n=1 Tax=Gangjinia marincola TaxID=578463 RepID=A0ABN1MIU8_9FLAO
MKNIAIAMGGFSSEVEISIRSGNLVKDNLDAKKYKGYCIHVLEEDWFYLDDDKKRHPVNKSDFSLSIAGQKIVFDVVYNTIHGTPGEDGKLQAYFELLGIVQTSCDFYQAALTFNKRDCISVLRKYGIKTAENFFLNAGENVNEGQILQHVGLPCFVKANRSGSSYGVIKVSQAEHLFKAIDEALKYDDQLIIESFLEGTEVSVGCFTYQGKIIALPVTEIVSENDFFDYEAKYLGKSQEITPARITPEQTKAVQEAMTTIYRVLNLKGVCRSEFIFHQGEAHFIEVNTNPGLSPESIIPQQVKEFGLSLAEFFDEIITHALTASTKSS